MNADETSKQHIMQTIHDLVGSDVVVDVEFEFEEQGARVLVFVKDEAAAQEVVDAINSIINENSDKGSDECKAGILCRAVSVFVEHLDGTQWVICSTCAMVLCVMAAIRI